MQEKLLYENMTYGLKMVYPNDWTVQEAAPNNMGLVAGFLAPGEDMNNPMDYVTVQIENLPPEQNITLDEYTGSILKNLESTYPDFQILSEGDMIMSGETAHVIAVFCDRTADTLSDNTRIYDKRQQSLHNNLL